MSGFKHMKQSSRQWSHYSHHQGRLLLRTLSDFNEVTFCFLVVTSLSVKWNIPELGPTFKLCTSASNKFIILMNGAKHGTSLSSYGSVDLITKTENFLFTREE
jgi:hypothetical protein